MSVLALVESPAQLLHLLEWALGERDGVAEPGRCEVAVLLPRDVGSRRQLRAMAGLTREEGLRVGLYDIRRGPARFAYALTALAPKLAAADTLVAGDPFSGLVRRLLSLFRARNLVLLDDRTAALEQSRELLAGRPLIRRPAPREGRGLEVFSCLTADLRLPPGTVTSANSYTWARQRFGPPEVHFGSTDMIGTSLAERGLIDAGRYVEEVSSLAHRWNAERYYAHHREDPGKLRLLAEYGELEIVRPELPLELELLRGPVAGTLLSLSSTVPRTLPRLLAGTGVEIRACALATGSPGAPVPL
ncbi:hypothetical protein GCM10022403_053160 [Streptomyces coacervatus]|uniref:Uncharacterized protein n=1 Tax=Streptomyces coacervatus TaxID=647381 RepID=A0ABP7I9E5_9ACTN|nr:hypothetical protein [Streptomyces coacervatus]MDF2272794.1 hypothetical protein [Streptomyces coacervatus]